MLLFTKIESHVQVLLHGFPSHMRNYTLEQHLPFLCLLRRVWDATVTFAVVNESESMTFFPIHCISRLVWRALHIFFLSNRRGCIHIERGFFTMLVSSIELLRSFLLFSSLQFNGFALRNGHCSTKCHLHMHPNVNLPIDVLLNESYNIVIILLTSFSHKIWKNCRGRWKFQLNVRSTYKLTGIFPN